MVCHHTRNATTSKLPESREGNRALRGPKETPDRLTRARQQSVARGGGKLRPEARDEGSGESPDPRRSRPMAGADADEIVESVRESAPGLKIPGDAAVRPPTKTSISSRLTKKGDLDARCEPIPESIHIGRKRPQFPLRETPCKRLHISLYHVFFWPWLRADGSHDVPHECVGSPAP